MKIGYLRVSKHEQNEALQKDALQEAGREKYFSDIVTGSKFERDLIRERTNAGLAAARARGRVGGRPRKLSTNGKVALALRLVEDPHHSIDDICSTLGISRSTSYRSTREAERKWRSVDPAA